MGNLQQISANENNLVYTCCTIIQEYVHKLVDITPVEEKQQVTETRDKTWI